MLGRLSLRQDIETDYVLRQIIILRDPKMFSLDRLIQISSSHFTVLYLDFTLVDNINYISIIVHDNHIINNFTQMYLSYYTSILLLVLKLPNYNS